MGVFGSAVAGRTNMRAHARLLAGAAAVLFFFVAVGHATAATPTILNTSSTGGQTNWLESFSASGETNNAGNKVRVSLAVKHDPGRRVTGLKIDDDWDGTDNTASKTAKTVTAQQPSMQGGYDHSRVTYEYTFPTSNTGMSCGAFGIGGTNKATKQIRVRAVLDNGEETATSSSNIVFTRTDCTGGEDYPYLYQWAQTATSVNTGGQVTFTFRGDDTDSTGNKDFAGVNWRMRRLSDGTTTTPQKVCYGSSEWDNQDKTLAVTFPNRGRWVVEAELLNNEGCNVNDNAGSWSWIGAVDVNSAAAVSPTASLSASRPQIGGNTTVTATIADGSDSAQGGRIQNVEWDLDNNTGNGVGGFEIAELGTWNTGLTSPRSRSVSTAGMAPGLKTVRVRVTDNGALSGADSSRRQAVATATYLVDTPPVASGQQVTTVTGEEKVITPSGTDVDGDTLAFSVSRQPDHGTVGTVPGGGLAYTSQAGYAGQDSFEFRADDGYGGTDTATIELEVLPDVRVTEAPSGSVDSRGARIDFASSVLSATFECSFDGEAWQACVSPLQHADLADGGHAVGIRATAAGLTNPSPASAGWNVDARPVVTIGSGPAPVTADTAAEVTFVATEAGATIHPQTSCRLDGGNWRPCASPYGYTDLDDGDHSIDVRAVDAYGKSALATHEWTISAAPPSTELARPLPESTTRSRSLEIGFAAQDPDSTFACRLDQGEWDSCVSPAIYTELSEGPHVFRVRAVSPLGVPDPFPAAFAWTVDLTPPPVAVTSGPTGATNDARPTFEFASSEPGVSFECALGTAELATCASPYRAAADLAEGAGQFRVVATDAAGNVSQPATRQFTVDTTPPAASITGGPVDGQLGNSTSAVFVFGSGEAGVAFGCRIDGGGWTPCGSPRQLVDLGDGEHRFEIRAADTAGNFSTPVGRTWRVDTAAPSTRIVSGPGGSTRSPRAVFEFAADEAGARFHCSLDGSAAIPCQQRVEYGGLADGQHTLTVRATDEAGNQDAVGATRTWTVDTSPVPPPEGPGDPEPEPEPACEFGADLPACGDPYLDGTVTGKKSLGLRLDLDSGGAGLRAATIAMPKGMTASRTKSKRGLSVGSVAVTGGPAGRIALKLPKKPARKSTLASRNGVVVTLGPAGLAIAGLPEGSDRLRVTMRSTAALKIASKRCGVSTWKADLTDASGNGAVVSAGIDRVCAKTRKGARK